MADESPSTAGTRFSEDLRQIREERDISVDEIHHETQIAETLIESFEAGRLYDHPTYNRVYLRSFVKAYADALNISRETALESLDAALEGTYDDALASRYLTDQAGPEASAPEASPAPSSDAAPAEPSSSGSPDLVETPDAPTAGGPEGRGGIVGPPRAVGEDPPAKADPDRSAPQVEEPPSSSGAGGGEAPRPADAGPSASATDAVPPTPDTPNEPRAADPSGPQSPPDEASSTEQTPEDASEAPDWLDGESDEATAPDAAGGPPEPSTGAEGASPLGTDESGVVGEATELGSGAAEPAADTDLGTSPRARRDASAAGSEWGLSVLQNSRSVYVTGAGIAVVLLVLVGLGVAYFSSDDPASSAAAAGPPDTTATASVSTTADAPAPQPPPAGVELGSTVHLTVLATSNVSALRIQRDDDLRRPYWIQEGEADVFPFQERVSLEDELSNVRLFVEGYPYPVSPRDTTGVLELTRSALQAFADTLRGAPPSLSVSPDTIPVGAPTQ
jgi:hypothetical protein